MPTRDPKGRGHAPNNNTSERADRPAAGYRAGVGNGKAREQRWEFVERLDDSVIARSVDSVTAVGDAIQFGRSRDGGALSITLYTPGGRVVLWCNTPQDAAAELTTIIEDANLMLGQ